jgi:hypothetical protein
MVNLVFDDYTSKPKLPIFSLIKTIAWNISVVLLFSKTSIAVSSTNLGVRFYGVSSLNSFLNDITLSHIYNSWPISKVFHFVDPGLLCGFNIVVGM